MSRNEKSICHQQIAIFPLLDQERMAIVFDCSQLLLYFHCGTTSECLAVILERNCFKTECKLWQDNLSVSKSDTIKLASIKSVWALSSWWVDTMKFSFIY